MAATFVAIGVVPATALVALAPAADAAQVPCAPTAPYTSCVDFTFSGGHQAFSVPSGVTEVAFTIRGAGGGGSAQAPPGGGNQQGGAGGSITGTLPVTPGQDLTVTVGGGGGAGSGSRQGGFGGGGSGGLGTRSGGGGGGMSALWDGTSANTNPLAIAGGGGGAPGGSSQAGSAGAVGGGTTGGSGSVTASGRGGTQTAGGARGFGSGCTTAPGSGSQFQGGNGGTGGDSDAGGGGGGGLFGGGGGDCAPGGEPGDGGGGGGSGFVSTAAGVTGTPTQGGGGAGGTNQTSGSSGSVRLQWVGEADISTVKEPTSDTPVRPGETFDYIVTASNDGPDLARNVGIEDPLPDGLSFESSVDGCTADGQDVTCGPEAVVNSGDSVSWTFTVLLDPAYTGDGSDLGNVATATSDNPDPNPDNNTPSPAEPPGPIVPAADLEAGKRAADPTQEIFPGDTFDFILEATNNGPSVASEVQAVDELPEQLEFVSSADDCTASGQTVTCGPQADLDVDATASWTITVRLDPSYTGDGTEILNTSTVSSETEDEDESNNTSSGQGLPGPNCEGVPEGEPCQGEAGEPRADLQADKRPLGDGPISPGESFDYELITTNLGPSTAVNVVMTDEMPDELLFVSSADDCTAEGQLVTCPTVETLQPDEQTVMIITVQLDPAYIGDGSDISNTMTATSDTEDPNPDNSTGPEGGAGLPDASCAENPPLTPCRGTASPPSADLQLEKVAETAGVVKPGDTFEYLITVTNNGPSTAVNVQVDDPLPQDVEFVSSSSGCTADGQDVSCPVLAALDPGDSVEYSITVQLMSGYTGDGSDIGNTATVTSDTDDPDLTNNSNDASGSAITVDAPLPETGLSLGLIWLTSMAMIATGAVTLGVSRRRRSATG